MVQQAADATEIHEAAIGLHAGDQAAHQLANLQISKEGSHRGFLLREQFSPAFKDLDLLLVVGHLVVQLELVSFQVKIFADFFKRLFFELKVRVLSLLALGCLIFKLG